MAAAAWSALPLAMVTAGSSSFSSTVLRASLLRGSFGSSEAVPASCTLACEVFDSRRRLVGGDVVGFME